MALKLHDYCCDSCDYVEEHLLNDWEDAICSKCGGFMGIIFLKPVYTDVYGSEQTDRINGIKFSSETDRRKKMRELGPGFEPSPSADKHHGARNEEHLNLGKTFSYKGARCN